MEKIAATRTRRTFQRTLPMSCFATRTKWLFNMERIIRSGFEQRLFWAVSLLSNPCQELLEMKPKISAFPSNVILYFRLVKRFFSDEYVNLNTRLTDSMTDVMAHASLGLSSNFILSNWLNLPIQSTNIANQKSPRPTISGRTFSPMARKCQTITLGDWRWIAFWPSASKSLFTLKIL